MKMSETVKNIFPAYIKARNEIGAIYKDKKVKYKQVSYGYADLPQIVDTIFPVVNSNGLAFLQPVGKVGGERWRSDTFDNPGKETETNRVSGADYIAIENVLIHESGEWISTLAQVLIDDNMPSKTQGTGASITYARRVSALAFWFLAVEDETEKNVERNNSQQRENKQNHINEADYNIDLLRFYIKASSVPSKTERAIIDSFKGRVTELEQLSLPSIKYWCDTLSRKLAESK
jgi:hypothetical protein